MKKNTAHAIAILAVAGYMIFAPIGEAAITRKTTQDLAKLQICIAMINQDARLTRDTPVVVKVRLADKYDLTLGKIDSLLGPDTSYGDLAAVLEFAKKMSGGLSDENINKIIDLRKSGTGWDRIAEKLELKLSAIALSLSRFEESTHSSVREALLEPSPADAAAGGTEEPIE